MKRILLIAVAVVSMLATSKVRAEILFESGTLGPTGISWSDLENGIVPGTTVSEFIFPGVRFELTQPIRTSSIGGHFASQANGEFFGAIVALDDENDFPNSNDLSTPDVLGTTMLTFPNPSAEVSGDLSLHLDPGWYALVFGSGLFETSGSGGAVRNGVDLGDPAYIGYGPNLQWFNLDIFQNPFDNHRFVITGTLVPEPATLGMAFLLLVFSPRFRRR